jgi:biopolymer transport protein ExbD
MAGGGGGTEELNLVPYLDVMVNLIIFMITVTAYIVQLKEAPVLAPAYGGGGGGGADQKPFLTLVISSRGFGILSSDDSKVAGSELAKEGGAYPWKKLNEKLHEYHQAQTLAENLVVTADGTIPYKVVIQAMDAARTYKKQPMFPGITLAATVGNK